MKIASKEKFGEQLTLKHVLFDTCVIIRAFEHFDIFENFLKFLEKSNCTRVCFSLIEFEFLRGAYQIEHKEKREEFLKKTFENMIIPSNEIMQNAIKIANTYAARKLHSASLTDCCIAAYLLKHHQNLLLATLNHKDFPTFLFDRMFIYTLDTEKEIFPIAFYGINKNKAKKLKLI